MGHVLISVRNASRIYRMGEVDVHALRDASLDVHVVEFLVIVGPSGSGKSTLLNLIGGMDRPTSGEVRFDGRDLGRCSDRELTEYRRAEVGFVFQSSARLCRDQSYQRIGNRAVQPRRALICRQRDPHAQLRPGHHRLAVDDRFDPQKNR